MVEKTYHTRWSSKFNIKKRKTVTGDNVKTVAFIIESKYQEKNIVKHLSTIEKTLFLHWLFKNKIITYLNQDWRNIGTHIEQFYKNEKDGMFIVKDTKELLNILKKHSSDIDDLIKFTIKITARNHKNIEFVFYERTPWQIAYDDMSDRVRFRKRLGFKYMAW